MSDVSRLKEIVARLRAPDGCPWDREQTHESLRAALVEECYEVIEAIEKADDANLREELGDLLLHVVLHAHMAAERKAFSFDQVIEGICEKLVRRHPHIYGDVKVDGVKDVLQNWEKIKLAEGNRSVLSGVPVSLPAMIKATRIQEKARGVGFDWDEESQVWDKVQEELQEFKVEAEKGDVQATEEEFGDLLFSLINYARFKNINPEDALEKTNRKFIKRFQYLEQAAEKANRKLDEMTLEEMDVYWNEAKTKS